MLKIHFNPFPVIHTNRILLRKIGEEDVAPLLFLRSDEEVMRYIDRPRLRTEADALALIARLDKLEKDNEGINWAICLKDHPETLIGTVCLFNFAREHYRGELGYLLHPAFQGKGLMQEAVISVLNFGFRVLNLHTIEANVNPGNKSSIKVLERNQFVQEAYFRENFFFDGKFLDTAVYTLRTPG